MILNSPYISGSLTVTGNEVVTGSLTVLGGITGAITGSATSASYAANTSLLNNKDSGEFVLTGSFNSYTSSNDATVTSVAAAAVSAVAGVNALAAKTGSYTTTSSFNSYTASNNTTMSCVSSTATSALAGVGALAAQTGSYATTGSNTFVGGQYLSSSFNPTGFSTTASLYTDGGLRVTRDAYISGTLYLNNVTVYGTQSVCYITSSQLNIASNLITVNTATPSVQFGGLAVYDSGSTGLTGSILWDSQNNHWVYSNPSGSSYSGGMFISGPRTSTLGSETGTTSCMLLAGQGGDHLTSSMIYHSSTVTCIPTAIIGGSTACFASSVDVGSYIRNTNSGADAAVTIAADGVSHYISATNAARTAYRNLLLNPYGCNVGIGTASPYSNGLSVRGASDDYSLTILQQNADTAGYGLFAGNSGDFSIARFSGGSYTAAALKIQLNTNIACFSSTVCASTFALANGNCITAIRNTGGAAIGVLGFTSGTDTLFIKGGTSGAATAMQFQDTGGTVMTLYNSCVGIGIPLPCTELHVAVETCYGTNGTVANSYPVATFSQCDCASGARGLQIGVPTGGVDSPVFLKVNNTSARFSIINQSNCENLTISNSGIACFRGEICVRGTSIPNDLYSFQFLTMGS